MDAELYRSGLCSSCKERGVELMEANLDAWQELEPGLNTCNSNGVGGSQCWEVVGGHWKVCLKVMILLYLRSDAETTDSLHQNKLLSLPLSLITASAFFYTSAFVSVSLCTSSAIFPCILFNIWTISLFTFLCLSLYLYLLIFISRRNCSCLNIAAVLKQHLSERNITPT